MICFIEKTKEGETKVSVGRFKSDDPLLVRWFKGWWFFIKWGTMFFLFGLLGNGLESENTLWMISAVVAFVFGPFGFAILDEKMRHRDRCEELVKSLKEGGSEEHPLVTEGVEEILSDEEIEKILEEYQETEEAKDER